MIVWTRRQKIPPTIKWKITSKVERATSKHKRKAEKVTEKQAIERRESDIE
jgi:hypothetical protein